MECDLSMLLSFTSHNFWKYVYLLGNDMGQYRIGTYLRLKPSARPSATLHVDATNSCVRVDLRYANGGPPRKHEDQMVFHFDGILQV